MLKVALDQLVGTMTVGDLKELMREVVREEQCYYIDEEGCLVFFSEDDYADYLDKQEGKLPSEVRAYFIDEQGYKAFYSDWVPTPEYARELDEARKEPTFDAEEVWEDLRKLGVDI